MKKRLLAWCLLPFAYIGAYLFGAFFVYGNELLFRYLSFLPPAYLLALVLSQGGFGLQNALSAFTSSHAAALIAPSHKLAVHRIALLLGLLLHLTTLFLYFFSSNYKTNFWLKFGTGLVFILVLIAHDWNRQRSVQNEPSQQSE